MRLPALLPLALTLPLLGACAPLYAMLAERDANGPSPRRAGPLVVGQTWTVSGLVDGRAVTSTVSIRDLVNVPNGTGSVNARDQIAAFEESRAGFTVADFNPSTRVVRFRWVGEADGISYTCVASHTGASPLRGELTYERLGKVVATGTCDALVSQAP
ncbi:hypothetical protein HNQ07_003335 [Deinococcus metalli]|uniref:Lipoprotein n=1 Tax=Deinococcus metalli TaxID=1141878 RepID=A0A7W8KH68_9DEIO|nr:hypothetical protein [Deinococcus metalli]MBB5377835.1 hypothetical protein [Deinococcus metalli]GHF55587.1 hypothetical protein GCM10017781_34980 [Deinococcus metalli]